MNLLSPILLVAVAGAGILGPSPDDDLLEQTWKNDSNEVALLDVYADTELATQDFKVNNVSLLTSMREHFELPPLSGDTADTYMQTLFENEWLTTSQRQFNDAMIFLDRLENDLENDEIVAALEDARLSGENSTIAEVTSIVTPSQSNTSAVPLNSGINLFAAQKYAERHANPTTFNRNYGYERRWNREPADCTNFASQILIAGGVQMHHANSKYSGWWWKSQWNRSVSWINANTFKNYMGSGYSTKNWSSLVSNVRNGDLIGLDFGSDGEVDHIGFVHSKSQGQLRIAQHSSDYISWQHGWANSSGVGTYYRIRR